MHLKQRLTRVTTALERVEKEEHLNELQQPAHALWGSTHLALVDLGILQAVDLPVRRGIEAAIMESDRSLEAVDPACQEKMTALIEQMPDADFWTVVASDYWAYFRAGAVACWFGLPGGERRLLEWTQARTELPGLTPENVHCLTRARAKQLW
jgi:hypothetical protein